ncbi:related to white collar 1 protein [Rhynchosporium secalis]|uniref:Related to white collar 1 protein n=1 Tax=Rhynchosporium secalis TaxID=38038 RepID=A0A1E1M0K9_RHYSE|nr:related to white collar 1 protein [Rhynchosporium secalis]
MNNFFGTQYSQEDLQQRLAQRRRNGPSRSTSMTMIPQAGSPEDQDGVDLSSMMPLGGSSLDDIIMQNNKEMQRRQSIPQTYRSQDMDRRASMMEFGPGNGSLGGYQFGPQTTGSGNSQAHLRSPSGDEMAMVGGYGDMSSGISMSDQHMVYSSSMQMHDPLSINTNSQYSGMSTEMMQNMMGYSPMGMEGLSEEDSNAMNMFSPTDFQQNFGNGNMDGMSGNFMMPPNMSDGLPGQTANMGNEDSNDMGSLPGLVVTNNDTANSPRGLGMTQNALLYSPSVSTAQPTISKQNPSYNLPQTPAPGPDESPAIEIGPIKVEPSNPGFNGIYSSSGFDMLGALMKVATRKNPEIDIGKVDMSCAFVVCDASLYDCPIIYVSEIFERLTGYTRHQVKGQNCRFLQSPEGIVQAGTRREFVDNDCVYYIKNRIGEKKEAQRSLINYRRGGQPFMNLLTMIPITGEDDKEIRYYVGFQVDLVEKPGAVETKNASGLYTVDYSQGQLPRYVWNPPQERRPMDGGQTISRDDVSTVLSTINNNSESELTKRMWDKVLLENTDDVVHVLSLKGLFLYLSPSCKHVLEYDASELVGTALSSVCHPSDIVPVTRELKDTSTGASVNVVFRIRRKKSGYTWFESHGSLCVEQGKGRKCIILVGRERPVYALHRHDIEAAGGIGENEMWTKLSTSGMFLFVSSNVRTLLDRSSEDLVGTSIQALMRAESRIEFGRSLDRARTGKRVSHKHEILNKRGLVLQAQTTLYPGDASEGQKPTFLVAQTRLLKSSTRQVAPAHGTHVSKSLSPIQRVDGPPDEATTLIQKSAFTDNLSQEMTTTARTGASISTVANTGVISQAGGSGLPIGSQDLALASEDNIFDELKTTRCTSWQFELRQMEKSNRLLAEELAALLSSKKKRKRRKGAGHPHRDCVNCHTRVTPEWRRGPSGQRDLCNSCGLRYAKQEGRVSPRNSSPRTSARGGYNNNNTTIKDPSNPKAPTSHSSASAAASSPLHKEISQSKSQLVNNNSNLNFDSKAYGNMKGEVGAALTAKAGGRSTVESMPVHQRSLGFRGGGERRITKIDESDEGVVEVGG